MQQPCLSRFLFLIGPTRCSSGGGLDARDENGNTTPVKRFWECFGRLDLSDTNLDSQGNPSLYDYTNGLDPNVISFSISATNHDVNDLPVAGAIKHQRRCPQLHFGCGQQQISYPQPPRGNASHPGSNIVIIICILNKASIKSGIRAAGPAGRCFYRSGR